MNLRTLIKLLILTVLAILSSGSAPAFAIDSRLFSWSFPEDVSLHGSKIDSLYFFILGVTGFVFLITEGLLIYFMIRYRRREGRRAVYSRGNTRLEFVWTIVPTIFFIGLAIYSNTIWSDLRYDIPEDTFDIEVVAEQFAWNFRYSGPDGKFARRDPKLITSDNPLGIDGSDPVSADDLTTINILHIPANRNVRFLLQSKDVIHSFFLPHFRIKHDVLPGMISPNVWVVATQTGTWEIACAELCGLGHYRMRGFITVQTPEEFQTWLDELLEEKLDEEEYYY